MIKRFNDEDRRKLVKKLDRAASKALGLARTLEDIAARVAQYDEFEQHRRKQEGDPFSGGGQEGGR